MKEDHHVIGQFMWGYQPHFRNSVRIGAESALTAIGFADEPIVFLVGFKVAGDRAHDICIEPEDGPYGPADFVGVIARAEELYAEHPESKIWHSVARVHESRHAALRDEMRADAIAEAFQTHISGDGLAFFGSRSKRVGDYEVHVILGVHSGALASVPQLRTTRRDDQRITRSLVHSVIEEILHRAFVALFFPDPGSGLSVLGSSSAEVTRSAADRFMRSVLLCAGLIFGSETDKLLSAISALPYEGRPGSGSLLMGRAKNQHVDILLLLREPIDLQQTRAVRKLLEASGHVADLLIAEIDMGGSVYGLGRLSPSYDPTTEEIFGISVLGRGAWDLTHGDTTLLSVRDGIARLPAHAIDLVALRDIVSRLLPAADLATLERLAQVSAENEHGAMLVISSDAASESERLTPQSWAVEPAALSDELLRQLTAMDGAVLVDPRGACHAVGVILDGRAAGRGDPARGSRFNNAVRYLDSDPPPAVVIVYSADGGIDILPKLRPRVERQRVVDAVALFIDRSSVRPPHAESVSRARRVVKALKFYLSEDQCLQLNVAEKALEEWNRKHTTLYVLESELLPDSDMNDTYWL